MRPQLKPDFTVRDYVSNLLTKFETSTLFLWQMSPDFTSIEGFMNNLSEMCMPYPRFQGDECDHNSNLILWLGTVRNLLAKFETSTLFLWQMSPDFTSIQGFMNNLSETCMPYPRFQGDECDHNSNLILWLGTMSGTYWQSLRLLLCFFGK